MTREIGTAEAAVQLGRDETIVAKKAVEVDLSNSAAVRAALAAKRLPGRKVGKIWLFKTDHVEAFGRIERPTGRPRKEAVA